MKWRVIIGTWIWVLCRHRDDCQTVEGMKWRGTIGTWIRLPQQMSFKEKEAAFLVSFSLERRSTERKSASPSPTEFELLLSFCMLLTTDHWRSMVRIFFIGSKSVRKLLSNSRIPRFSSQVLCRLRNKAAQEIGSCGRRRRTWIWEWKRKRFFLGFFFFPPSVVRRIPKNNKNKKDAQETSSQNLFLEVKSCCSLRVRFGNLS